MNGLQSVVLPLVLRTVDQQRALWLCQLTTMLLIITVYWQGVFLSLKSHSYFASVTFLIVLFYESMQQDFAVQKPSKTKHYSSFFLKLYFETSSTSWTNERHCRVRLSRKRAHLFTQLSAPSRTSSRSLAISRKLCCSS